MYPGAVESEGAGVDAPVELFCASTALAPLEGAEATPELGGVIDGTGGGVVTTDARPPVFSDPAAVAAPGKIGPELEALPLAGDPPAAGDDDMVLPDDA